MKKYFCIFLAALMALSLAACGGPATPPDGTDPSGNTTEPEPQTGTTTPAQQPPVVGELTEEVLRNYPVTPVSDFEYETCEGGIRITNYIGTNDIVVIPETIDGQSVVEVAAYIFANDSIVRSILLPKSVKALGKNMFINNKNLEIVIAEGVESLGDSSFSNCANIKLIMLGDNLRIIEEYAFAGCVSLEKLMIPETVTEMSDDAQNTAFFRSKNLTIYGKAGSYIETVANEQGIPFVAVD